MPAQQETHENQLLCKRCGRSFTCRVEEIENCQCNTVAVHPSTLEFLGRTEWGCLCAQCLKEIDIKVLNTKDLAFPKPNELKEGIHFYMENGFFVFTEYYHLLRGHCCKSGCRHCAYGFRKQKI